MILLVPQVLQQKCQLNLPISRDVNQEDINHVSIKHSNFCCAAYRQNNALQLKKVLRQLYGITLLLQNYESDNAKGAVATKTSFVAELPLQTLQQFTEFEKKLNEDLQLRNNFEGMILRFGGETAIKHLKNILKYTFTTEMRNLLCWSGQKGRVGLKTSLTAKVIIETIEEVREHHY
ncbi:uncharacterized protein LOC118644828 [Monomorium pharaonis]|uniref:uncharacterized protein LOC118644828 n=1 Tax=Monomorium pharaonis TaxID=307658 RepID=UPI0017464EFA|nr:uncharacterized protein LOC118644828 [Monomorium pharaonis]